MSAPASFSKREFYQDYATALDELTPFQRRVFELMQDGETQHTVARSLGLGVRSVGRAYQEARASLASRLAGYKAFA